MFSKEDFVPETDELKMTNPFLYNFKDNKNIIYSIEEFGLLYKKRKIYVGSVVRNEELSKFRKRKILKKLEIKGNSKAIDLCCGTGDVARILFYMSVHYELDIEATGVATSIEMLLEWNSLDLVDDAEATRNDVVQSLQGNRNPFIDYPEYAEKIWG